jgi:hypothetical protein
MRFERPRQPDPTMESGYRRALARRGEKILVERISGSAPNTVTFSVEVVALVKDYTDDGGDAAKTGYGGHAIGGITQGARRVVVMWDDLEHKRFPLPLAKNDRVFLISIGEKLNVIEVDRIASGRRQMIFDVQIDATRAVARLDAIPAAVLARLLPTVESLNAELLSAVQSAWPVRTGASAATIHGEVENDGTGVIGSVTVGGGAEYYARFVEYGADIPPHDIMPNVVQALHFMADAGEVYARVVHHPGADIPARDILQGALASRRSEIAASIEAAIQDLPGDDQ